MPIGADIVVRCLEREQVSLLFAYPGATAMSLHHALLSSQIKVVRPCHEQGGAFMAGGYARRTGDVGVCVATSGPGATNLVTGITDAYADSIPTVFICCQVDRHLIGRNAFQETDIIGMTRPCVKHSYLLLDGQEIPAVIKDAFFLAKHGRPGPVVIDIPQNVLQAEFEVEYPERPSARCLPEPEAFPQQVFDEVMWNLHRSRRPCIFAGGGVIAAGAAPQLLQLAENFNIPVTTSLMGIGAFPENHPLALKMSGMHGTYAANMALHDCDFLLAIGVRFCNRVTGNMNNFAPGAKIVHLDIDPSEINKNIRADWAIVGPLQETLEHFLERKFKLRSRDWLAQIQAWKQEHPLVCPASQAGEIHPQHLVSLLHELTKGRATLVTGVGQHQMWTAQFYNFHHPRQLLTSGGLGAMGFGLPAAIGAQLACPEEQTILIDGDGSFQMNIQELATVFTTGIPLKIIVVNNQRLGMVAQWEDKFYQGVHAFTDLSAPQLRQPYPDLAAIATAYRLPAERVTRQEDLEPALRNLLEADAAALLEVMTAPQDLVMPMIPADADATGALFK